MSFQTLQETEIINILKGHCIEILSLLNQYNRQSYWTDEIEDMRLRCHKLITNLHNAELYGLPPDLLRNPMLDYLVELKSQIAVLKSELDSTNETSIEIALSELRKKYYTAFPIITDNIRRSYSFDELSNYANHLRSTFEEFEEKHKSFLIECGAWNDFFVRKNERLELHEKELSRSYRDAEQNYNDLKEKAATLIANIGSKAYAKKFEDEADQQGRQSLMWLFASLAIAIALMCISQNSLSELKTIQTERLWPTVTTAGIIISVLSVYLFQFIRNFAACRHNIVVNRHRANALSTFDLFSSSAPDEASKAAVLKEATQAVFSPVASGYLKSSGENGSLTQVIELIRPGIKDNGH